jgi:hypothetical protein
MMQQEFDQVVMAEYSLLTHSDPLQLCKETNICHLDEFSPQSQNTGHQGHENFLD